MIDDLAEVHRLQQQGHSWSDDMALVCKLFTAYTLYTVTIFLDVHTTMPFMCRTILPLTVCVMFYVQCLGQVGRVSLLDESGHPSVRVNGWQWVLHSSCVMLELAEQPEDEMSMNCKV